MASRATSPKTRSDFCSQTGRQERSCSSTFNPEPSRQLPQTAIRIMECLPSSHRPETGSHIAGEPGCGHFDLRLLALDGSEPKVLVAAQDESYFVRDWSPNGKKILVRTSSGLALVAVEDGSIEEVVKIPKPSFCSDGAHFSQRRTRGIRFGDTFDHKSARHPDLLAQGSSRTGWRPSPCKRFIDWLVPRREVDLVRTAIEGAPQPFGLSPVNETGAGKSKRAPVSLGHGKRWAAGVTGEGAPVLFNEYLASRSLFG